MKKYRLLMSGRNLLINVKGKIQKYGFYQNIYVEADNPQQAELSAIAQLNHDQELKRMAMNGQDNPPVFRLDTFWELENFLSVGPSAKERTYFPDKRWWQFWR
jgi:hypothetical protein